MGTIETSMPIRYNGKSGVGDEEDIICEGAPGSSGTCGYFGDSGTSGSFGIEGTCGTFYEPQNLYVDKKIEPVKAGIKLAKQHFSEPLKKISHEYHKIKDDYKR